MTRDTAVEKGTHTATPWTVEHHGGPWHLFGANDERIGTFSPSIHPNTEKLFAEVQANAQFIVTAVNCHAELLDALKQINALPSNLAGNAWAIARAAITTVEGHGIR